VRDEHVQQPVATPGCLAGEVGALRRDVMHDIAATRVHPEDFRLHF
jgi:hypothetical protein